MNPTESATEKVFTALREAAPPPGMESRILRALEAEAAAHPRPGILSLHSIRAALTSRPALTASIACAVVVAAATITLRQNTLQTSHQPGAPASPAASSLAKVGSDGEPKGQPGTLSSVTEEAANHLQVSHQPGAPSSTTALSSAKVGSYSELQEKHPGAPRLASETWVSRKLQGPPTIPSPDSSEESQVQQQNLAATEATNTNTPSFPAPPMPLTDQERLLLKIAHLGDPQEIAMLNPETRALIRATDDNEFKDFFAEPPIGDQSENQ